MSFRNADPDEVEEIFALDGILEDVIVQDPGNVAHQSRSQEGNMTSFFDFLH